MRRRQGLAAFAKALPRGMLRSGMTARRAGDTLCALGAPRTRSILVEQLGWTAKEYEAWLLDAVDRLLIA